MRIACIFADIFVWLAIGYKWFPPAKTARAA